MVKVLRSNLIFGVLGLSIILGVFCLGLVLGRSRTKTPELSPDSGIFVKDILYTLAGPVDQVKEDHLVLRTDDHQLSVFFSPTTKVTLVVKGVLPGPVGSTPSGQKKSGSEIIHDISPQTVKLGDQLTIRASLSKGKFFAQSITASRNSN